MKLDPIYIPFQSVFPNLVGLLSSREDFAKNGLRIDPRTPYGQAHKSGTAISRRISNLQLIMHRIRLDSGIKILPKDINQIDFLYLPIDYESFFIWLRLIMDLIAYLTPFFYENRGTTSSNSFNNQMQWFIEKRPEFDKDYSDFLKSNLSWFSTMRDVRDDTLHNHYWSYAEMISIGRSKLIECVEIILRKRLSPWEKRLESIT